MLPFITSVSVQAVCAVNIRNAICSLQDRIEVN